MSDREELGENGGVMRSVLEDVEPPSDVADALLVCFDVAAVADPSASPAQSAPVSAIVAAVAPSARPRRVRRAGCRRVRVRRAEGGC
ncbi:MAG TPA: hypothetical protein VIH82_04315 [Acidimicrobiia bacterium]